MKNQPNRATVKDGLPTAHSLLSDAYQRHGWLFQPDVLPSGACPHEKIAMEAMQEYSDQQNAELRERVKALEGALTATLNVARAYDRSRFVDILDKAEKTLKK